MICNCFAAASAASSLLSTDDISESSWLIDFNENLHDSKALSEKKNRYTSEIEVCKIDD